MRSRAALKTSRVTTAPPSLKPWAVAFWTFPTNSGTASLLPSRKAMGEVIRKIIKVDGTEVPLPRHGSTRDIAKLIGADTMDTVILTWTNGVPAQVMLVDDLGYDKGLPVNAKATA